MEDELDADALQARVDISLSLTQELVASWIKPYTQSDKADLIHQEIEKDIADFRRRPAHLGVGAVVPETSFASSSSQEVNRLKGRLTKKRPRHAEAASPSPAVNGKLDDSDDEEESRTKVFSKKQRTDGLRPRKGVKDTPAARLIETEPSLLPDAGIVANTAVPESLSPVPDENPLSVPKKLTESLAAQSIEHQPPLFTSKLNSSGTHIDFPSDVASRLESDSLANRSRCTSPLPLPKSEPSHMGSGDLARHEVEGQDSDADLNGSKQDVTTVKSHDNPPSLQPSSSITLPRSEAIDAVLNLGEPTTFGDNSSIEPSGSVGNPNETSPAVKRKRKRRRRKPKNQTSQGQKDP
ncbi:hypothetical protein SISNIDRAFT_487562 [Sistotremastrum niveocremeum HHB9708]|uniref:Uncharacterized protein n=1 Tax=Sistotremastrum niveocremeum HHB9708 TaxID=1314777 RepID=A0A164S810_9AGAM|nr:hypothetical protein SISNIDRAFT_487562 [Sistotremastrum niveocremeum HHB9708]